MAKKKKAAKRKYEIAHLGISWQAMKIGAHEYAGTAKGCKANASRANRLYAPKKWRTYTDMGVVYVQRLE